jgi:hypothetical protein
VEIEGGLWGKRKGAKERERGNKKNRWVNMIKVHITRKMSQ